MQWYTGNTLYDTLLLIGFAYAILVMVSSFFGTAAYGGRFGGGKRSKGIKLGSKAGWILMELPGTIGFSRRLLHGTQLGSDRTPLLPGRLDVSLH
jgi:3-oxo-5-alpha-steroid 4-dehydrogenase 1